MSQIHVLFYFSQDYLLLEKMNHKLIKKNEQQFSQFINYVNDSVRISAYNGIFDRKYKRNWTLEIFTIDKVQDTKPITYLLKDKNNEEIKGCFYRQELQKVNLQ